MHAIWLRMLLLALTAALTFETPAPEKTPERTPRQEERMLQRMEQTEDIRECIRLGAELELELIDLRRFERMPEEMDELYQQLLGTRDLPWYMDLSWSYKIAGDENVSYLKPGYLDPAEYSRSRYEAAVEKALAEAVKPGMSEVQVALSLHDYLASHCAYDESLERGTEYDVLVHGSAVCQGYAEAYMDLLGRVGIECIVVTSEEMNHAWNQVKLDGQWYHVDVTWDDPSPDRAGMASHGRFLISDGTMATGDYGYYGWESPHTCSDQSYETGQFWSDSISPVIYEDADTCYLIRIGDGEYEILRRDADVETLLTRVDFKYPEAFAVGGRYIHFYTAGLSLEDGFLYYTDVNGVRRLDPASREVTVVYKHDVSQTRQVLVGSFLDGGTLQLTTMDRDEVFQSTQVPFSPE